MVVRFLCCDTYCSHCCVHCTMYYMHGASVSVCEEKSSSFIDLEAPALLKSGNEQPSCATYKNPIKLIHFHFAFNVKFLCFVSLLSVIAEPKLCHHSIHHQIVNIVTHTDRRTEIYRFGNRSIRCVGSLFIFNLHIN